MRQLLEFLAGVQVPDAHRLVAAGGDEGQPVAEDPHALGNALVGEEHFPLAGRHHLRPLALGPGRGRGGRGGLGGRQVRLGAQA